ncbi:MAG: CAAX prenyl protease-related protein [Planctomycetia bacterium]|nr:CAAX prenyl protease-related protein [Planctomycetia bacterium]
MTPDRSTDPVSTEPVPTDSGPRWPWETCLVPFVVFLVGGVLEPLPGGGGLAGAVGIPYAAYPLIYAVRLVATGAALAWVWRPIREWVGRTTWWPVPLGLLLVIPWIVLAALQRESGFVGQATERSGFDPFTQFASPGAAWGFLAVRFLGLVAIVPIVEELFLRGFLMRYVIDENFRTVPFGRLTLASTAACLVYAVVTHPAEALAALAWFAVMSGVAAATRRPIDVILAHAATNLALGVYVVATRSWWLL